MAMRRRRERDDETYTTVAVALVKRDSGKAFLFVLAATGEEVWLPHSTLENDPTEIFVGDEDIEVSVKDSFLKYKDIRV